MADCKEKWKNIRNGFVRSLKPSPSGSSSKAKKPYYLHDIMRFVLPYVRPVQHLENTGNISLSDTEIMTQPDEDESQSTKNVFEKNTEDNKNGLVVEPSKRIQETPFSVEKKKKKKNYIEEKDDVDQAVLQYIKEKKDNKTPDDDRQMFLLSLLPDVRNLSEKKLRQFKIKTLILLEQLLTQQEQPTDQHFQMYTSSQVNHYPTHHDSSASRCSSVSSINNTVSTPAPSPIGVASTPSSIIYNTTTDEYAINNLESIPPSISKIGDPRSLKENESFFFRN